MTNIATTTKDHDVSLPGTFCHANHLPCPYKHQRQLAFFFSPSMVAPPPPPESPHTSIPGTWVDSNLHYCHCQTAANHQEDMNHLRETIASLRDQAKQLEMTDLMVKKSIQVVAKKRRLAQHTSQWDWCDPLDGDDDDDDDDYEDADSFYNQDNCSSRKDDGANVPVLDDDASETDHSVDDDDQDQDCGGDWEWIY